MARINAELSKAVTSASFKVFATQNFMEPMPGTPAQFANCLSHAQAQAARTFKALDIQLSDAPTEAAAASR